MAEPDTNFSPEELQTEIWKTVPDYEGFYEASTLGRIRRAKAGPNTHPGRIVRPQLNRQTGYYMVRISKQNKLKTFNLHRLVAAAFLGPCPDGCEVNHVDGTKTNNRSDNLEYVTALENHRHAAKLGLVASGENHGLRKHPNRAAKGESNAASKLTAEQIKEIRKLASEGISSSELAIRFQVSGSHINTIRAGKTWRHLSSDQ